MSVPEETEIKRLQKALLGWIEEHPDLLPLHPERYNGIRKRVFRSTWDAYRMGVLGIPERGPLWEGLFGWIDGALLTEGLPPETRIEIRERALRSVLISLWLGARAGVSLDASAAGR